MPELPEVELVARGLDELVRGRQIVRAKLLRPLLARESTPQSFARLLRGARILEVRRRGKHILFMLDNGRVLITHLRMSGRFMLLANNGHFPKHTHAVFYLDNARRLVFTDQRHFGMMKIVTADTLHDTKELRRLAPEPFADEFTVESLSSTLAGTRRAIKEVLLDQTKVSGLGNIYAAEVLFLARVNPFAKSASLSRVRVSRLHGAIRAVLSESLSNGSTLNVHPEHIGGYYGGTYEEHWRVYGREGEPCPVCGRPVRRVAHGGRSTFYCPRCQR